MARLQSIADLAHYCLRALGGGVNEIEVTDEQLQDRLDEAISFYVDRHFDGTEEVYFAHMVDQHDIDNGGLMVPSSIRCVTDVQTARREGLTVSAYGISIPGIGLISNGMTPADMAMNGSIGFGDMTGWYIMKGYMNMINDLMTAKPWIAFNHATSKVQMLGHQLVVGEVIMVHGYRAVDPEDEGINVYDDRWLKKYATALIKQQWGQNLSKYDGVKLPGDVTIDGDKIYSQAEREIEKLEQEFEDRYESMASLMIG